MNWNNPQWSIALFLVYVATSCFGLYLIKAASSWTAPAFAFGFALYAIGALLWLVILRLNSLSFAFPVAAGALVIGTILTGTFFLHETMSAWQITGVVFIVAGITLVAANR